MAKTSDTFLRVGSLCLSFIDRPTMNTRAEFLQIARNETKTMIPPAKRGWCFRVFSFHLQAGPLCIKDDMCRTTAKMHVAPAQVGSKTNENGMRNCWITILMLIQPGVASYCGFPPMA